MTEVVLVQCSSGHRNWIEPEAMTMLGAYYCAICGKQILMPLSALTAEEMKAQAERCGCRGADDYCLCQNVPDSTTLANRSRNVSGNENGKELPVCGKELPKRRLAPKASVTDEQILALIDAVQSMPRSSPKTIGVGGANMPLFIGMQPDPDGAWVHWFDIVKELRRMIEQNPPQEAATKE